MMSQGKSRSKKIIPSVRKSYLWVCFKKKVKHQLRKLFCQFFLGLLKLLASDKALTKDTNLPLNQLRQIQRIPENHAGLERGREQIQQL